jgi:Domain of unknown function (DUF1707)
MFDRAKGPEERRKLRSDQLRVSDADRMDAIRRLRAHEAMGHLQDVEASHRVEAAKTSSTPEEVAKFFVDLPALAARPPSIERRISTQDRQDAIFFLERAYSEGRIEAHECAAAKDQVDIARTRSEIDAAFHGLSTPTRAAMGAKASIATKQAAGLGSHVLAEGGRRAGKAFRRGVLGMGALAIGVILLIAGTGPGALVFFLGAVALFVSAAISVVS